MVQGFNGVDVFEKWAFLVLPLGCSKAAVHRRLERFQLRCDVFHAMHYTMLGLRFLLPRSQRGAAFGGRGWFHFLSELLGSQPYWVIRRNVSTELSVTKLDTRRRDFVDSWQGIRCGGPGPG